MAQIVMRVDDIDLHSDATHTVAVGWNGKWTDLDLSDENFRQLAEEIEFWTSHGCQRGAKPKAVAARKQSSQDHDDIDPEDEWWRTPDDASSAEQKRYHEMRQEIRDWGRRNGYPSLGDRGALPRSLYAKWRKAHQAKLRHRKPDPEETPDTEASESETDPAQGELDMTPRFSEGHKRKAPAKKPASHTRSSASVKVAS